MTELKIEGMNCHHCVKAVTETLAAVPGVSRVDSVDLDTGIARIEGEADIRSLLSALATAGYNGNITQ